MQEWADVAYGQIMEQAKTDALYCQRLGACRKLEPAYLAVLDKLDTEDQAALEAYISACEELEHRLAQLAYEFGKTRL
jgi:hypothetical protein